MQTIDYKDFEKIDFRVGTIIQVENFEKPATLPIKFGLTLEKILE